MSLKKDKQKILGEVFDTERVKSFIHVVQREGIENDFDILEKAYRGMKAENFAEFVTFFNESGHNIHARNTEDKTLLQVISDHRHGEEYVNAIKRVL